MRKAAAESISTNPALLNVITPMGLEFRRGELTIGENTGKVYGVIKYPAKVDTEWLSKITNIPSTVVNISFRPIDNGTLINAISRSVVQQRGLAEGARDPLSRQRAEKAAADGEKIIMQIDREGEMVGLISTAIMPVAKEEKTFKKVCRSVESTLSILKCKGRVLANLQKEAFQHISPTHLPSPKIESILQRIVPLSTFVGGFPFASSGFNDGAGYYFARDNSDGLVILDLWKRGGDRTNSNFVAMGGSGMGKSTVVKSVLISEYMMGTRIFIEDPESEYKDLCHKLCGDWINAVGGKAGRNGKGGGMVNPLQIRPSPRDADDEKDKLYQDEGYGLNDMALHLKNVEIFFNLYIPSITDMQRAVLKKCLIELYNHFGIDWDTDITGMKPTDFPIMSDLYALVYEKAKQEPEQAAYQDLALLLFDIAKGADSFIWNGHTTVKPHSRFVVLDTSALQNMSDNIKRAQYFNLNTYCWEEMSRDRNERVIMVCDEAYLMIDPQVPQSLIYLRNVEKRARKYEGALFIISHSVVDFLDPAIKQYGQALLDIPTYKVLMGSDGQNLKELTALYNLTEAEQELLLSQKRRHALFSAGSKRLHVVFKIPDYKFDYMGSGGGR